MQARFRQPWAAQEDAEMVAGSMHADRILVPEPALRALLKKFRGLSHDVTAGLTPEEHAELLQGLCDHPLRRYLVGGCPCHCHLGFLCVHWLQLSTTSQHLGNSL